MSDDLITPDNLSKELLKSVFDDAFMETSYDDEGDLKVKEGVNCFIFPNKERKDRVTLLTFFRFKKSADKMQRLECVNSINREYIIVRAVVGDNDVLRFTYDVPIAGGITKKAMVMVVKRFCSIPHDAVGDFGTDIVE